MRNDYNYLDMIGSVDGKNYWLYSQFHRCLRVYLDGEFWNISDESGARINQVPYGKYKKQHISVLANDLKYLKWLIKITKFHKRYPEIIYALTHPEEDGMYAVDPIRWLKAHGGRKSKRKKSDHLEASLLGDFREYDKPEPPPPVKRQFSTPTVKQDSQSIMARLQAEIDKGKERKEQAKLLTPHSA